MRNSLAATAERSVQRGARLPQAFPKGSSSHRPFPRALVPNDLSQRLWPPKTSPKGSSQGFYARKVAVLATDDLLYEHRILTDACGLLDRSQRGKLALTGSGAVEFLNGQVTNELADLRPGEGRYAAFLTHKGKMLGDLRILAVGDRQRATDAQSPTELLLDTERVALQGLFDMIRRFKVGYRVALHKRTLERALLSLIGPNSRAVAARASGSAAGQTSTEHANAPAQIDGCPVLLIATDAQGVDVLCDASDRDAVYAALQNAGASPVSEQAAEIVRVERGRPRYGVDIDETTIPQEAALNERAVSFTKGCYVGQETVARLYYKGKPNRHLRGLLLSAPVATGAELRLGERAVGHLGSVALSPRYGPIALALVRREAQPGASVSVGADGTVTATIVALPFRLPHADDADGQHPPATTASATPPEA
jgi:folate-binding protein YgfZ